MPEAAPDFKYTVGTLAGDLGIEPASVRVALRNASIAKTGRMYGWNSQKDYDSVLKRLRSRKSEPAEPATAGNGKAAKKVAKATPAPVKAKATRRGRPPATEE
jgi:hypothetical protein